MSTKGKTLKSVVWGLIIPALRFGGPPQPPEEIPQFLREETATIQNTPYPLDQSFKKFFEWYITYLPSVYYG